MHSFITIRRANGRDLSVSLLVLLASLLAIPLPGLAATFAQPPTGTVEIGDGFQMAEGTKRISCLKDVSPSETTSRFQSVTLDLSRVSSIAEMQRVLSISASAKFGGGLWSAQGSASWMSSGYYRSNTVTFTVRVNVQNEEVKLKKPELDPKISTSDPIKFFKRCGDHFVSSVQTGGEFIAVFHFEASTEEEASKFGAAISGGIFSGPTFSSEMEKSLRQFRSDSRLSVELVRRGPRDNIPELTPDSLTIYAREFPSKVATGSGNPSPISFEVTPYTVFGLDPPDIDSTIRDFVIIRLAQAADAATARFDALQYVLTHTQEFSFVNKATELVALNKEVEALQLFTDKLRGSYKQCTDLQKLCSLSLLPIVPETHPPQPLSTVGGCTQWTSDDKQCLECRYTAAQLGVSYLSGSGFSTVCRNMPPKANVDIGLEGSVHCGFTNEYGNHCGDSGGKVSWWVKLSLDWREGAAAATGATSLVEATNIQTPSYLMTASGKATVPTDGLVSTQLTIHHLQMWPNAHGPLVLDPGLWVKIRAQGAK